MTIKLLDLGRPFGLPVAEVFKGTDTKVLVPDDEKELREMLDDTDIVGFGGGADIHPSLYGSRNVASSVGHGPSVRDMYERRVFNYAVENGIPIFGICRGAQLVCALSGGKLVQDVEGHGGMHTLSLDNGGNLPMTSTHHQMMYPWRVEHKLLAWTNKRSKEYLHDIPEYVQHPVDPEVVYFKNTNALAVQGHPEWMDPNCATVKQVRAWINEYLNVKV